MMTPREKVISLLKDGHPWTREQIKNATQLEARTLTGVLIGLMQEKRILFVDEQGFQLTKKGRRL